MEIKSIMGQKVYERDKHYKIKSKIINEVIVNTILNFYMGMKMG